MQPKTPYTRLLLRGRARTGLQWTEAWRSSYEPRHPDRGGTRKFHSAVLGLSCELWTLHVGSTSHIHVPQCLSHQTTQPVWQGRVGETGHFVGRSSTCAMIKAFSTSLARLCGMKYVCSMASCGDDGPLKRSRPIPQNRLLRELEGCSGLSHA